VNKLLGFYVLALFLMGCQGVSPIGVKTFVQPEQQASGKLLVADLAKNVRKEPPNLIGYHTITVFGFRTSPISPAAPLGMQDAMTKHIMSALRTAGYEPVILPPGEKSDSPVLRGEIRKFWFASYWWFWPITVVGGDIKLRLILESPEGEILWEKEYKGGKGGVQFSMANVESCIKHAATQVCNKVIEGVTSDEFREALRRGGT